MLRAALHEVVSWPSRGLVAFSTTVRSQDARSCASCDTTYMVVLFFNSLWHKNKAWRSSTRQSSLRAGLRNLA